jgi:flagellar hook protein FlgE
MSLGSALNASVSGLRGQSAAIAAVSENIANASTTAYKKRTISFESLVTSSNAASSLNQVGGGVKFETGQNLTEQGLIQNTGIATNIAVNGQGFFTVTDDPLNQPSGFTYTRNGDFSTDQNGLLINNEGMILLGQRTDIDGVVISADASNLNSLEPIDLDTISGTAGVTTQAEMDINLPSDSPLWAVVGDPEYITAMEIFDGQGNSLSFEQTWRKTGPNTWAVDYTNPFRTNDTTKTPVGVLDLDGAAAGVQTALEITFNGDGSIDQIATGTWTGTAFDGTGGSPAADALPFDISIAPNTPPFLDTGADPMTFELDLGTHNLFDGLTQFASSSNVPSLDVDTIEQDGVRFGQFSGVEINSDGLITALFDNGVRRPIFQIPLATFPNPEGLTNIRGTIYDENETAGNLSLNLPTQGNAGNIEATSLEQSTVDSSDEFNKMIVAQQAYSSAAQVLSTVDDMFETLIGAVR